MAGVNKVILLGNLGADPEVKYLESGSVVAKLRLATTETYRDRDKNKKEVTEWHDIEMWDGLAKIAEQYLKKGDSIYVEGKIKSDTWQDDQGNNRKKLKIRAQTMTMLSKGSSGGGGYDRNAEGGTNQVNDGDQVSSVDQGSTDDLPF